MTDRGSMVEEQATAELQLSSAEYRMLADLLLEHLQANDLQDEQLEDLVNRLYLMAVRVVPAGVDRRHQRDA